MRTSWMTSCRLNLQETSESHYRGVTTVPARKALSFYVFCT